MAHPSPGEIVLLLLLCAASVGAFWLRFGKVYRTILGARPDADFQMQPIDRRLHRLFREVLCQAKVIRERPLPGLAHALVFWGFCAFALVTLNHMAAGVGLEFLSVQNGLFGPAYHAFAAVFALAVAVGITGLTIRRFVVRPRWLGDKVSLESGLIAVLILLLMLTYLADYLQQPAPGSAVWKALWWTHTLALLVFLPLLPHTKHLHLLLSPAAVFLDAGRSPISRRWPATRTSAWTPAATSRNCSPCRPTPASNAAAASSTAPPTTPVRSSTPNSSPSACGPT